MQLQVNMLSALQRQQRISLPAKEELYLPEKVLQFGTGVLLRGLPDYYINKANRAQIFNGRIVVVKSTGSGSTDAFAAQDCLYTHCIKGIENNQQTETYIVNSAISRVVNANEQWKEVLNCAVNPQLQIIVSNTTEVGITLLETDSINAMPPVSFPGKLLAFLYARFQFFNGSPESGMVIIPTELIVDNGHKLKEIVYQLAQLNHLEEAFINWLMNANDFCNSLVDRIVPGALPNEEKHQLENMFGYTDDLAIMSEPYSLWAIETKQERTKQLLSFTEADTSIVITENIYKFRELKLRLLNGTHTFSCGFAFLHGFTVVNAAMKDNTFHHFISSLMMQEIVPCISGNNISSTEAEAFAGQVINRFSNPFIQHKWLGITMQYTNKMKTRCIPLLKKFCDLYFHPPVLMTIDFAAYLLFMKATVCNDNKYYGERKGENYWIQDDEAGRFYTVWKNNNIEKAVTVILADTTLWNEDLNTLPGFSAAVTYYLNQLVNGIDLQELVTLPLPTKQSE